MIKRISIDQLQPGMVVQSFVGDWPAETFHFFGKTVPDRQSITELTDVGIRELYVHVHADEGEPDLPTQEDVERLLEGQLRELGGETDPHAPPDADWQERLGHELEEAVKIEKAVREEANRTLESVRMGGQVDLPTVISASRRSMESIFRDHEALTAIALLKNRSDQAFEHSVNVAIHLQAFGRLMGWSEEEVVDIGVAGMLHDLGMAKVPFHIVRKTGRLTRGELQLCHQHVEFTLQILESVPNLSEKAWLVAAQHHERFDGTGYPKSQTGRETSIEGEIAAIIDTFDAMTSWRPYHKPLDNYLALRRMMEFSNYQYNMGLFQFFVTCVGLFPVGTVVHLKDSSRAVVVSNHRNALLFPVVRLLTDATGKAVEEGRWINLSQHQDEEGLAIVGAESETAKGPVNPFKYLPNAKSFRMPASA
ncbi:MAG: HD domain-containing protein [Magnetococcales bacterium]|nr:HD domain-containing protein [Magnetococcales bacterium]MBF0156576.1 HD domain-containing protein [Magnetococcales bacterium]